MDYDLILLRLKKESPKKCSLTPLRRRDELPVRWIHCAIGDEVDVGDVVLLHPDGEVLSPQDRDRPLLLIDSSWRDLPRVLRGVSGDMRLRKLPNCLRTAYPRKSLTFDDPTNGLASIEALHAACALLGKRDDSLLDGYYWADEYLRLNAEFLPAPA
jgi:pre-rRNA-processing protein TSR3